MEKGNFKSFAALKQALGSIDKVGDLYVFNIGGNKYRLIAYVRFDWHGVAVIGGAEHKRGDVVIHAGDLRLVGD